jgi:hypothetical protein
VVWVWVWVWGSWGASLTIDAERALRAGALPSALNALCRANHRLRVGRSRRCRRLLILSNNGFGCPTGPPGLICSGESTVPYALGGMLFCAACGRRMQAARVGK